MDNCKLYYGVGSGQYDSAMGLERLILEVFKDGPSTGGGGGGENMVQ